MPPWLLPVIISFASKFVIAYLRLVAKRTDNKLDDSLVDAVEAALFQKCTKG